MEDPERSQSCQVAKLNQWKVEAQIGMVGAIPIHAFGEAQMWERHLPYALVRGSLNQLHQHLLDQSHHVWLGDERHFEVQLGELGLAISAQVLIPEAARDLEIAINPGDHE